MPYPTAGDWYIAVVSRNDVDVQMRDRLPGGFADVDAEVVAIRLMDTLDRGFGVGDRGHQLDAFLSSGVKPRCHMASRGD